MYLFSREAQLTGDMRAAMAWAVEMTAYVNDKTSDDIDLSLWQTSFGRPMGTVTWSTMVESRAALAAMREPLLAEDEYWDKVAAGADYSEGPPVDHLRQIVHMTVEAPETQVGSVVQMITAAPAAGHMLDVLAWGPEIADKYSALSGAATAFCADAYGAFGQVTWYSLFADMAGADAAAAATMGDEGYLNEVNKSGGLFLPGSGEQRLAMRIA